LRDEYRDDHDSTADDLEDDGHLSNSAVDAALATANLDSLNSIARGASPGLPG
jgi:hypothetical protein